MKKLCLLIFALFISAGIVAQNQPGRITMPRATGFVNDFAGIMTRQDQQAAERLAGLIRERTGAELVIVTVESFASQGDFGSIDEFSLALAESWGIGARGQDNGVLFVLAMAERQVKIEVGYGLEGIIPDSVAGRILDTTVIPAFRQNDFSGGLLRGLEAIAALVARENGLDLAELNLSPSAPSQDMPVIAALLPLIWIFIIFSIMSRSRRRFRRLVILPGFGMGTRGFGSTRHFGGGGFGRPPASGGFGGFGGGSFGGGGASRRF